MFTNNTNTKKSGHVSVRWLLSVVCPRHQRKDSAAIKEYIKEGEVPSPR
jgi:hypothetical protein